MMTSMTETCIEQNAGDLIGLDLCLYEKKHMEALMEESHPEEVKIAKQMAIKMGADPSSLDSQKNSLPRQYVDETFEEYFQRLSFGEKGDFTNSELEKCMSINQGNYDGLQQCTLAWQARNRMIRAQHPARWERFTATITKMAGKEMDLTGD